MKRHHVILLTLVALLALIGGLLGAWGTSRPMANPTPAPVAVDYQPVSVDEAERLTGLNLPLPAYLPEGFVLEGVYVYFRPPLGATVPAAGPTPLPRPGSPFQLRFQSGSNWMVLKLYGGDTRSDEVYSETGGEIPADFGLSGEEIEVNGAAAVLQTGLDERGFATGDIRIRSRLVWRLAYASAGMPSLRAIFLALESLSPGGGLSRAEMIRVAESVR